MNRFPASGRLVGGALAAVAVVAVVGVGVAVARSDGAPRYRTAVATPGTVVRTLEGSGTITPSDRVSVSFPSSGTVKSVKVTAGQHVKAGQALASLDPTSLQDAVDRAVVTLTQAQLTLAQAEAGQLSAAQLANAGSASSGGSFGGSNSGSLAATSAASGTATAARVVSVDWSPAATPSASPTTGGPSPEGQIAVAQRKLLELQKHLDAALAASRADVAAAVQACGGGTGPTTTSTTSTTIATGGECLAAQQASLDQLATVASLERQVQAAISTLDDLLRRAAAAGSSPSGGGSGAASSGGTGPTSSGRSPTGSTGSFGSSGSTGASSGAAASAAQLAALQTAVDAARAKLAATRQSLAAATIVSPIDGTVTAVGLTPGKAVSASSSSQTVVVAGAGGFEVSTAVPVAQRAAVKVGQPATVTPDNTGKPVTGKVVAIDVAGTTSGSSTTYTVVIGLSNATHGLRDGTTATTTITLSSEHDRLVVPTSAVHADGSRHTVTVLESGRTRTVTVGIGTVSAATTAITTGLEAGQVVVLADLNRPLPTSASNAVTSNRFGRFGGFDRGGPGGFTGPRGFSGAGGGNAN